MIINFDSETHTYTDEDGNTLPSVTTILSEEGLIDTTWFKPEHAQRGTDIHEATAMIDKGDMSATDFPEWMHGYLDAWQLFKIDEGFTPELIETIVSDGVFAGTVDRVGNMRGKRWLLDIKTGRPSKWHRLQTSAYAHALEEPNINRGTVHITKDGKYRFKEHDHPSSDMDAWLCLIGWRIARGLYK